MLQTITRKLCASLALWIAAKRLRRILSLTGAMSLTSPVTGLRTSTGFSMPNAAARGWKSPSPMNRNASTSASTASAALQLHPRTCPGWHILESPVPTSTVLPEDSRMLFTLGISPRYWTVTRSPTLCGSSSRESSTESSTSASERDSM